MPAPQANEPNQPSFDPTRHRKEIELMEQRFRERSERHGGGPVSTGEIDSRVADEMRQFFDDSAQHLESAIPQLQEGEHAREMAETTGEIRRKIDDFFAQVKEKSASDPPAAGSGDPRIRRFSGPHSDPPPIAATVAAATPSQIALAEMAAPPAGDAEPAPGAEVAAESDGSDSPEEIEADGAKMDLKTALEKLRRSGGGGRPEPGATPRPIPRPASLRKNNVPRPSVNAASAPFDPPAASPTPRPAPSPVPASPAPARREPTQPLGTAPAQSGEPSSRNPRASSSPRSSMTPTPQASAVPPVGPDGPVGPVGMVREPLPQRSAMAPRQTERSPAPTSLSSRPAGAPPTTQSGPRKFSGRQYAAHMGNGASAAPAPEAVPPLRNIDSAIEADKPSSPAPASPKDRPSEKAGGTRLVAATAAPVAAPDPAAGFDSIFDEVQGIVMGTLKASLDDSFDAARRSEPELAEAFSAKAAPTVSPIPPDPVSEGLSQSIAEAMREPAPPPMPQSSTRFAAPVEDDIEQEDKPPTGPYDWGVKAPPKPKGAWLLDTPENPASNTSSQTITNETRRVAAPSAGGGAARGYLMRKAANEVKRFQPVLETLRDSNVLSAEELGDAPGKKTGDEDFVSADSFKDDRPRGADMEEELSPMRLVEELRRLKRVTQALVSKGIISQDDLSKASGD